MMTGTQLPGVTLYLSGEGYSDVLAGKDNGEIDDQFVFGVGEEPVPDARGLMD